MDEDRNTSTFNISYTNFFLVGFPGLSEWRPFLVLPLTFLYVSIISANALVIHTVAAQRSLHQPIDLMTSRLLGVLAFFALTRSLGVAVPLVVLTSRAQFCRTAVIRHFTCEYIALLSIACGDLTFNNHLGLAMRLATVSFDLALLGTSYTRIIYAAFQISSGGARAKALHTCGSHLLVILTIYLSGLSTSIVFRVAKTVSQDVQNLLSAIYLLLPGTLNPVIYGVRTREVRQHIEKMLCGKELAREAREKPERLQNMRVKGKLPG
ncbi:hypothetical protein MJG53_010523 [Ovis ammon polii x Ovis aries]|nr:hypothetical protein MJG53_010523 [Ovis ammon polii x Ovis aries]